MPLKGKMDGKAMYIRGEMMKMCKRNSGKILYIWGKNHGNVSKKIGGKTYLNK